MAAISDGRPTTLRTSLQPGSISLAYHILEMPVNNEHLKAGWR